MQKTIILALTLMLTGRAMILAFIHRAGGGGVGDPPLAWLMPLIGDSVVGLSGLGVAYLIWTRRGLAIWTLVVVWNAIAIWDAMSAYIIHLSARNFRSKVRSDMFTCTASRVFKSSSFRCSAIQTSRSENWPSSA
jgi:hypothetical protein